MAYTEWDSLDNSSLINNDPLYIDQKLDKCTPAEDNEEASFYVEDIIRVTNQTDFHSIRKVMARFWGERHQVWVGYKSDGITVLKDVIALRCPPYYPPHSYPGVNVSDVPQPENFPGR